MQLTKYFLIFLATFLLLACSKDATQEAIDPPTPFVLVAEIEEKHLNSWQLTGKLEPQNQAKLGFQVAGELTEKLIVPGDKVKKDQVLLKLDPQDIQLKLLSAKSNLKATQAEFNLAQTEAKRAEDLVERKLLSQQDFDRIQNQVTTLEQRILSLTSEVKLLERQLNYTVLTAPADGLVQSVLLDKGDLTQAGQTAVELLYLSGVDLVVDIPESRINNLPATAQVTLNSTQTPAKLREIDPKTSSASRTWQAKFSLDIPLEDINFGATARISFASEELYKTVPLAAIFDLGEGQFVWHYQNGKVTKQEVELVHLTSELAYITTPLPAGAKVVRAGVHLLTENQKVQERNL